MAYGKKKSRSSSDKRALRAAKSTDRQRAQADIDTTLVVMDLGPVSLFVQSEDINVSSDLLNRYVINTTDRLEAKRLAEAEEELARLETIELLPSGFAVSRIRDINGHVVDTFAVDIVPLLS